MDIDLLFTAVKDSDYKSFTESAEFRPDSLEEEGYIRCFQGDQADKIINSTFEEASVVLLIVIDPLRIQSPIKRVKEDGVEFIQVRGAFSIDSIIDKIKLHKDKKGKFNVRVKHFD